MAIQRKVSILDYLRFENLEHLHIVRIDQLDFPASYESTLQMAKRKGIYIRYDQNLRSVVVGNGDNTKVGTVTVYMNPHWKDELLEILQQHTKIPQTRLLT
jgi:hypothetical protein